MLNALKLQKLNSFYNSQREKEEDLLVEMKGERLYRLGKRNY